MLRPKEVVQLWVDAFNKHDVEAITALYHENATNHQVANEPVVGIEAIRTMFTAEFSTADMMILSILVDTFISKISLPMQPVPEIRSISGA